MAKDITLSWTETRRHQDVVVPLSTLVELMMEHAPDDIAEAVAERFAEKGRTEIEEYAPIFTALRAMSDAQGCIVEDTDFDDIEHDA